MAGAVKYMHQVIGLELGQALRMATTCPANVAQLNNMGKLCTGAQADFVWLSDDIQPRDTWLAGRKLEG